MSGTKNVKATQYQCSRCKTARRLGFEMTNHRNLVSKSPNGLVTYSDYHFCQYGLTAINSLSIDIDLNIRSFKPLELPEYRTISTDMPIPQSRRTGDRVVLWLTHLPGDLDLHLLIKDELINTTIKIGRFDHEGMIPITTLTADMGLIEIEVYPTGISYTPEIEKWFSELITIIEILPPTTLGLLVETFKYISLVHDRPPTQFDLKFLKTILASHEVFCSLRSRENLIKMQERYKKRFSDRDLEELEIFIRIMEEHEYPTLKEFTSQTTAMELISIIYLFLILEEEGIITMERPGILE